MRRMKQAEMEERAALARAVGEYRPAWVSAWGADASAPRFAYMRSVDASHVRIANVRSSLFCYCSAPHMDPGFAMAPDRAREGGGFRTGPGSWKIELPRLTNRTLDITAIILCNVGLC